MLGGNLRFVVANWAADRWTGDFPDQRHGRVRHRRACVPDHRPAEPEPAVAALVATGFLGGYTTFSSYTWEAQLLAQTGWLCAGV